MVYQISKIIKLYLLAFLVFLSLDIVWLALVAKNFYAEQIGFLMANNVNWFAALVFYLLFVAGLVVFVIYPAVCNRSFSQALLLGAFFGLVAYATYDLTSLAIIRDWPAIVTFVDLAWGTLLSAIVSIVTYKVSL